MGGMICLAGSRAVIISLPVLIHISGIMCLEVFCITVFEEELLQITQQKAVIILEGKLRNFIQSMANSPGFLQRPECCLARQRWHG